MTLKKLLPILLFSIFLFSCGGNQDPTKLSQRAGTYEGGGYTLIVKSNGEVQVVDTQKLSYKATLEQSSTATSFDVDSFKIDFSNGVKINTAELTKVSDSQTFLLTLADRVGVYELIELNATYKFELKNNGEIWLTYGPTISLAPLTKTIPSFNNNSIITELDVKIVNDDFKIIFKDNNKSTLENQYFNNGTTKTLTKQ